MSTIFVRVIFILYRNELLTLKKYRWLVHSNRISCHELFNISSGQGMNCRKFGFRHLDLILKLKGGVKVVLFKT